MWSASSYKNLVLDQDKFSLPFCWITYGYSREMLHPDAYLHLVRKKGR